MVGKSQACEHQALGRSWYDLFREPESESKGVRFGGFMIMYSTYTAVDTICKANSVCWGVMQTEIRTVRDRKMLNSLCNQVNMRASSQPSEDGLTKGVFRIARAASLFPLFAVRTVSRAESEMGARSNDKL